MLQLDMYFVNLLLYSCPTMKSWFLLLQNNMIKHVFFFFFITKICGILLAFGSSTSEFSLHPLPLLVCGFRPPTTAVLCISVEDSHIFE